MLLGVIPKLLPPSDPLRSSGGHLSRELPWLMSVVLHSSTRAAAAFQLTKGKTSTPHES